jgi:hypothetical protein
MRKVQIAYRLFVLSVMATTLLIQAVAPAWAAGLDGGIGEGLAALVKKVIDGMIIAGGIVLAFFVAFTNLSAIIARGAGMPHVEANATIKIISLVALFGFLVFSIAIANAVIDGIMAYHTDEAIHVPTP